MGNRTNMHAGAARRDYHTVSDGGFAVQIKRHDVIRFGFVEAFQYDPCQRGGLWFHRTADRRRRLFGDYRNDSECQCFNPFDGIARIQRDIPNVGAKQKNFNCFKVGVPI